MLDREQICQYHATEGITWHNAGDMGCNSASSDSFVIIAVDSNNRNNNSDRYNNHHRILLLGCPESGSLRSTVSHCYRRGGSGRIQLRPWPADGNNSDEDGDNDGGGADER